MTTALIQQESGLEDVWQDLFKQLEDEQVSDLSRRVDLYFEDSARAMELASMGVDASYHGELSRVIKQEILPAYEQYQQEKTAILEKKADRKLWKYVVGTVLIGNVLEAIVTRGKSMRPPVFVVTGIAETIVGTLLYGIVNLADRMRIDGARKRLEKTVTSIASRADQKHLYRQHLEVIGQDLMEADAIGILSTYDNARDFWADYKRARIADPTNTHAIEQLGLPAFSAFLHQHCDDEYTNLRRNQRWDKLFVMAHEYFLEQKNDYALTHLEGLQ